MKRILAGMLGLLAPMLVLVAPALAGPREDVLYGISRCGGIASDRTWLDCVYGAAQPMRAQLGLSAAPASQQALVPPAMPGMAAPTAQNYGPAPQQQQVYRPGFFERLTEGKDYVPDKPTTLAAYKFDGAGLFTVTLATGEVWEQNMGDTRMAHWNKPARTYAAQILMRSPSGSRLRVGADSYMVDEVKAKKR